MTFIHMSDVHLGMMPDADKPWATDRAYDIKETFYNVIKKCNELKVNLLLIAGDLFHRQPLTADLNEVNELFKSIPNTEVVIIAGNSDKIRPNSSVLSYKFHDNVHYILNEYPTELELPNLNTVIHGFSYHSSELKRPFVDTIKNPDDDGKIHILLAHGGDENHCPIDFTILANKNFTYCALGHFHQYEEVVGNRIVYSGSLEPLDMREVKAHGVCIGEIHTMTKRLEKFHFEPMSKISYIPLSIKVTENTTNEELVESISKEIVNRDSKNIYKLTLSGDRDANVEFDLSKIEQTFRIVEIIDSTEPKYDFKKQKKDNPNNMIGAFIRSFNLDDMSDTQKQALYYGIDALLKTRDK